MAAAGAAALLVLVATVWLLAGRDAHRADDATGREAPAVTPADPAPRAPDAEPLAAAGSPVDDAAASPTPEDAADPRARPDHMPPRRELARMTNFDKRQFFDRSAARAAGLDDAEIEQLYQRWLAAERAIHSRIALDAANGRPVRPNTRSYDDALREFLDDDELDVALYATNQLNRVHLVAPEQGGRPMAEGLLPGDVIETYDGQRVFRLVDLQLMIKETTREDVIPVVVRRGGQLVEVDVPGRHPLGPKTPRRTVPLPK